MEDNEPLRKGPLVYLSVEGRMDAALVEVERNNGKVVSPKHSIGPHGFRAIIIGLGGETRSRSTLMPSNSFGVRSGKLFRDSTAR